MQDNFKNESVEYSLGIAKRSGEQAVVDYRRLRIRIMVIALLIEVALLLWFAQKDLMIERGIMRFLKTSNTSNTPPNYSAELKNDPKIGAFYPEIGVDRNTRKLRGKKQVGFLVAYVGNCASCLHANLREWEAESKTNGVSMILLTTATHRGAMEFENNLALKLPVISDTKGSLVKKINAIWPGRAYLFSRKWRLLWLSMQPDFPNDPFSRKSFQCALEGRVKK